MIINRPYTIHCDAVGTPALEMFSLEKQRGRLVLSNTIDLKDELKSTLLDAPSWLPLAAECYNISANIKDYILQPVISMPSALPNRNSQAFPFSALSAWTPDAGCVMYKTWNGKPVHEEHKDNQNYANAKGIILSTLMRPIRNTSGDIWKVIKLVAFDRNRDSVLANEILAGRRNAWSMGAYARSYTCSICASDISKQCGHAIKDKPEFKLYNGKLAYWNVVDPYGFEISNVKSPAFASAKDTKYFTMDSIHE